MEKIKICIEADPLMWQALLEVMHEGFVKTYLSKPMGILETELLGINKLGNLIDAITSEVYSKIGEQVEEANKETEKPEKKAKKKKEEDIKNMDEVYDEEV